MVHRKLPITVLIAAKNEALNLPRCLSCLDRAERIVVIDSCSSDQTSEIATRMNCEVVRFIYSGGYPKKRQWALDNVEIATPWVLLLDADEVIPDKLWREIDAATSSSEPTDAFFITKGFHFLGRRMRYGGFSHAAVLLFRKGKGRFERLMHDDAAGLDMEVHERLIVEGRVERLRTPLIHEDFKGLEAYIARHNLYSTWEAKVRQQFLTTGRYGEDTIEPKLLGNAQERRRWLKLFVVRLPFEHWVWFVYHYVLRLGVLEGTRGLIACQIRASYIQQVRAKVFEMKLTTKSLPGIHYRED